jgi:DEAD/DEAH box helicase domain-containing protein
VGTVDGARVSHIAHPGAIYLHQGRQYRVDHLDLDDAHALMAPVDVDEYTQPRHDIDIAVTGEEQTRAVGRSTLHLGTVEVTTTTDAYQRRRTGSGEVLETVRLELPPRTLPTRAGWYTVPVESALGAGLDAVAVLSAAHAAEHALIGMLPLFAICDRWDVGGVSMAVHPATGEPTIFIYDGYPGGAGIAEWPSMPPTATWPPPTTSSPPAPARPVARRASSPRSAGTGTSTSTSGPPSP